MRNKKRMQMPIQKTSSHASKHISRSASSFLASGNLSAIAIIGITTVAFPRPLRSLLDLLRAKGTIPTVDIGILVLGQRGRDGHLWLLWLMAGFAVIGRGDAVLVDGVVVSAVVATLDTALLSFCCCIVELAFGFVTTLALSVFGDWYGRRVVELELAGLLVDLEVFVLEQ
ncbi:hypothetical protein KCU76_g4, partial [Aureobasidium melanogenum]